MYRGWIKLHRDITDHWIWSDPVKLKWWLDLLLTVNHSPKKTNIGMVLIECNRGQSLLSLSNWAKRWGVTKDTARNFISLLEKDGMIIHENLQKTTRITVCNYDEYQSEQPIKDNEAYTQKMLNTENSYTDKTLNNNALNNPFTREPYACRTQADPNKNDKNINNDKREKTPGREDQKIPQFTMVPIDELRDFLNANQMWKESVCMLNHISINTLEEKISQFIYKLKSDNVAQKTPQDAYSHFSNWLRIQLTAENKHLKNTNNSLPGIKGNPSRKRNYDEI